MAAPPSAGADPRLRLTSSAGYDWIPGQLVLMTSDTQTNRLDLRALREQGSHALLFDFLRCVGTNNTGFWTITASTDNARYVVSKEEAYKSRVRWDFDPDRTCTGFGPALDDRAGSRK
jgi:hypothetical protein